jgi:hypothetical protein
MSVRVSKELSASAKSLSMSRECFIEVYINNQCLIIIVYLQTLELDNSPHFCNSVNDEETWPEIYLKKTNTLAYFDATSATKINKVFKN